MSARRGVNRGGRQASKKVKSFSLSILIEATRETFVMKNITGDLLIGQLKADAEFMTGIPANMQQLTYLDEGELLDKDDIRSNYIVPGAQINMKVWHMWKFLVEAVASNDIDWVFKLGVSNTEYYSTPNFDYMNKKNKEAYIAERAFVALYVAAHRGHMHLCRKLIDAGADVNACTRLGRTALHVAAAKGRGDILDMLLANGADIHAADKSGETALTIAERFGHTECAQRLFMFRWKDRAKHVEPQPQLPLFAHQYYDSKFPVWKDGSQAKLYFTNFMPPGEFSGTHLSAPHSHVPVKGADKYKIKNEGKDISSDSEEEMQEENVRRTSSRHKKPGAVILAPINEEKKSEKPKQGRRSKTPSSNPPSFDQWLQKKQTAEQKLINVRKAEEEKQRLAEEDKKLEAEIKDKSYEQWLAEKEANNGEKPKVQGKKTETATRTLPAGTVTTTYNHPEASKSSQKKKTTLDEKTHYDLYLEKMKEAKTKGSAIYNWLNSQT